MFRVWLYLAASALVWAVEGFLFAYFLRFSVPQSALLAIFYIGLFTLAIRLFSRSLQATDTQANEFSAWRVVSLLPMLVVILGSFVSLPAILVVVLLGKLL